MNVITAFANIELGVEATVRTFGDGYMVTLRDTDADETIPAHRKFTDRAAAIAYAKSLCIGDRQSEDDRKECK